MRIGMDLGGTKIEDTSLDRYLSRLSRALAAVVNVVDPHVIVFGGGLSRIDQVYTEVPKMWGNWVLSDRADTRLDARAHGVGSGVRGAAWRWPAPDSGVDM